MSALILYTIYTCVMVIFLVWAHESCNMLSIIWKIEDRWSVSGLLMKFIITAAIIFSILPMVLALIVVKVKNFIVKSYMLLTNKNITLKEVIHLEV